MPKRIIKLGLRDEIDENLNNVVFDFRGFDDLRLEQVAKQSDLVIIPFNPTIIWDWFDDDNNNSSFWDNNSFFDFGNDDF
jgi:hypothetical protein